MALGDTPMETPKWILQYYAHRGVKLQDSSEPENLIIPCLAEFRTYGVPKIARCPILNGSPTISKLQCEAPQL